jgi:DNA-binding NarL/FixJ family response regulator
VVIVDDHRLFVDALALLLGHDERLEVIGTASDGPTAIDLAVDGGAEVAVIDVRMPEVDGIEATRRLLAERPKTAVLVLTSFSDRPRIMGALEAGASGYLLKDVEAEEVAEGIRAAARGESPLDPRAARTVLTARAEPDPLEELSTREREVLGLLLEGLPNKLIARRLDITEKTVKSHLTRIFREIGVTDRTQAALWAERHGLGPGAEQRR